MNVTAEIANRKSQMADDTSVHLGLASDARFAWGLVPADCKWALIELQKSGRLVQARSWILKEATLISKVGTSKTVLDVCFALELAAEHYLEMPADAGQGEAT